MASLGEDLRREREARGISLDKIAASTKIGRRYLEALEADRYDLLPSAFFAKGIVRTYARSVGLDEEALVAKYAAAGVIAPRRPPDATVPVDQLETEAPRGRSIAKAAAVIATLAVVSIAAYMLLRPQTDRPAAGPADRAATPPRGTPAVLEAAPPAATEPSATPADDRAGAEGVEAKQAPAAERLTLEISFSDLTWLQVFADGRPVVDGLRSAGESVRVEADDEIVLHTGNAGGMALRLDGRDARPLGRSGQVVKNVRITRETVRGFLPAEENANRP